jgi:hypothetical protein
MATELSPVSAAAFRQRLKRRILARHVRGWQVPNMGILLGSSIFGAVCLEIANWSMPEVVDKLETQATRYRVGFGQSNIDFVAKRIVPAGPPPDEAVSLLVMIIVVARQAAHQHKSVGTGLGERYEKTSPGDAIDATEKLRADPVGKVGGRVTVSGTALGRSGAPFRHRNLLADRYQVLALRAFGLAARETECRDQAAMNQEIRVTPNR